MTNDFLHAYAWDANGRPVTLDSIVITYDALGRMVEQNRIGAYTEIVYTPSGAKLALMNGSTLSKSLRVADGRFGRGIQFQRLSILQAFRLEWQFAIGFHAEPHHVFGRSLRPIRRAVRPERND